MDGEELMKLHLPEEYQGEELCICCGAGFGTGRHYVICADGFSHDMTCEYYKWREDRLCDECESRDTDG